MRKYINKESVLDIVTDCDMSRNEVVDCIEAIPSFDVAPVRHGRWEVIDEEEPRRYGCSECKRLSWHMENYCPCCGSKMDGGDEDEKRQV